VKREMLRKLVADVLQVQLEAVPANATSDTLEGWDSLRHLDIIMAVEAATHITFSTADVVALTSLEKLERALDERGWKP
jgi:acyl carrier protein